ncbi:aromatic hydrocarbon degradation protein [Lentimicrobium sp.]|jgi:long-subunit fatty acid transport protein|uniref:OmpP1/FadL family transporter n=1 Tax=Lentimicrobium sp. TaxID=2034841 RepID=UPI0025E3428B|nr:aromatic hydrocarbon degradation protein [Lentimicrobium sp.]MCO5256220.1 aromatic hydrocarbon degradation protein [Lentimicrobium sp.]HOP12818.1 aromatic hydrocarbon degradation protein [Lentimicrobium sp.]HPF64972.1 aromatic hydrocarbon degradation protein [Lentimicrobium sp.]HPJ63099.1 aromatic hydrocarbon degradation protein [Lentimicrobium sp.]HPR26970.1 aromatic hydrocarbon degradation protein [Lentimicrobium sp.]
MKKTLLVLSFGAFAIASFAGGIVHNTNQSASFIRMPARDASLGLDGVFYNPAGLTQLKDGFHLSLNNQYITQTRKIYTNFPGLNRDAFEGSVVAPLFPSVYAAYKTGKLAFSLGFNPVGGGGSALFEDGLPSFEMQVAGIPGSLSNAGIQTTKYSFDTEFEGKSVFYGIQAGASYQVNEILSVSLGLRYVMLNNSYTGHLSDIMINPVFPALNYTGEMVSAPVFFGEFSGYLGNVSANLGAVGSSLQPVLDGGGGNVPLSNGTSAGLTAQEVATLQGTITALGGDPSSMTIAEAQGFFIAASANYAANSEAMAGNAAATQDKEVDASQSGTGIVPIIGVNLKFERFNVGLKYEHKASIKVKNSTKVDDVGLYPDKAEVPSDLPAMFTAGIGFEATKKLNISAGLHYYFDKSAEYGKKLEGEYVKNDKVMDKNFWEFALGLEYAINEKWLVSAGYLRTQTGVMDLYQTDLSHSLSTNSIAAGLRYMVNEKIGINLGAMNTAYVEDSRDFPAAAPLPAYTETYNRSAFTMALGIDISF